MVRSIFVALLSLGLAGCYAADRADFVALAYPGQEILSNRSLAGDNPADNAAIKPKSAETVRVFNVSFRSDIQSPRSDDEKYAVFDLLFQGNRTSLDNSVKLKATRDLLSQEIALNNKAHPDTGGDVILFVHGYNNKEKDVLERAGQLSGYLERDQNFHGTTISFDWQSAGANSKYLYDLQSANFSRDALSRLLYFLATNPQVRRINIVAHSMGNWLVMEALRQTAIAERAVVFDKIIKLNLVNADIDADVFGKQLYVIYDRYPPETGLFSAVRPEFGVKVRVFANPNDKALEVSGWASDRVRVGNLSKAEFEERYGGYFLNYTSTTEAMTQKANLWKLRNWRRDNLDFSNLATRHWPLYDPKFASQTATDFPPDKPGAVAQAER